MPRTQRRRSDSGFYHTVIKGDGGQLLFENDRHRSFFLKLLEKSSASYDVAIHAYCLMGNHVHLLVKDKQAALSGFMKTLDETYAEYFAKQTGHVGHVLQGRFWSEPIECDRYYLATLRYIHANPEPAGICAARNYPWSSYQAYTGKESFVATEFALELLGGREAFEIFQSEGGRFARPFGASALRGHLTSDELARVAAGLIGEDVLRTLKCFNPQARYAYVQCLANAGFSESEIVRVTGLGRATVRRAVA